MEDTAMTNIVAVLLTSIGCLILIVLTGCSDTRTLMGNQVSQDDAFQLTLYLRDGRTIELPAGQYRVRPDSAGSIEGTGRMLGTTRNDLGHSWKGSVAIAEIDSVHAKKDQPFWQAGGLILGASIVAGVMVLHVSISN